MRSFELNENTLLKNIGEFNTALKDRSIDLLQNILNAQVTLDVEKTRNSSFAEIQNVIGAEAISVEIPVDDNPQGMVYLANAELMPELAQYLRQAGEGAAQVPQSMQLILDAAEQLSALKKQIIEEKYKKIASFGNPSIVLWQGESEEIFKNGLATYFSGSIGGDKIFNVVRIIHTKVANHLMGSTSDTKKITVQKSDFEQLASADIGITNAQKIAAGALNINSDAKMWFDFMIPGKFFNPFPVISGDYDLFVSSSFFPLRSGQSEPISVAVILANAPLPDPGGKLKQAAILRERLRAQETYNNDYQFSNAPYIPTLTAIPGNNKVTLYWNKIAETSFNRYLSRIEIGRAHV